MKADMAAWQAAEKASLEKGKQKLGQFFGSVQERTKN